MRVAQHHHVAHRIQEDQTVCTVELLSQVAEDLYQIGPFIAPQLVAEVVHDDLGISLTHEMIVGQSEQLGPQLRIIGELAVEGEAEPLPAAAMMALERLGVAAVGRPTGGIADMTDGGPARVRFACRCR